ncbi:MAG: hypothetical protein JWQ74_1398 [Marmoricola sp.]|nr:hypothetical protein [Marmoricola sp.]
MAAVPRRSPSGSLVLLVIATLLLPCARLSSWVSAIVTDTNRYVATVEPLATDPVLQAAAERELERAALRLIDFDRQKAGVEALIDGRVASPILRQGVRVLTTVAREQAEELVRTTVRKVVQSPYFAEAWRDANRSAHAQLVAVLEGNTRSLVGADGRVSIELSTVLGTVAAALEKDGLVNPDRIPEIEASFPLMKADDLTTARSVYRALDVAGFWLSMLWALTVAASVLLARQRRKRVASIAWASAAAAISVGLLLGWLRARLGHGLADPTIFHSVWDIVIVDLRRAVRTILLLSALALAAVWLIRRDGVAASLQAKAVVAGKSAAVLARGLTRQQVATGAALLAAAILAVLAW